MPLPIVAIEVEPPGPPAAIAEALVGACSQAAAPGHCLLAKEAPEASHRACVSWLDERHNHVLVEVGQRGQERGAWQFRRIRFSSRNAPTERWRAIGFTIAGLAHVPEPEAGSPIPAAHQTPAAEPAPSGEPRTPSAEIALGLGGLLGTAFSGGALGYGVVVDAAFRPAAFPLHPVLVAAFNASDHGEVSGQWWRLAAGIGTSWVVGPLRLGGSAVVGVDVLTLQGVGESADRALPTFSLGALAGWPAAGPWGISLGARWFQVPSPTEVFVNGTGPVVAEAAQFFGYLGAELRL